MAGTTSPDAVTVPPADLTPVDGGGAVTIGVGAGVGEPLHPAIAAASAIEMLRNVNDRLSLMSLNSPALLLRLDPGVTSKIL
jgi:hypothetical protein